MCQHDGGRAAGKREERNIKASIEIELSRKDVVRSNLQLQVALPSEGSLSKFNLPSTPFRK